MRRLLLLSLLALTACASKPDWAKPSASPERTSADYAACRRYADKQMPMTAYVDPDDRSSDPMRQMDRDDNRKQFGSYVALCMEEKGYRRVK